jgi:methanogenic corrinoid protein MtbC1
VCINPGNSTSSKFESALLSLNRVAANNIIRKEFTGDNAFEVIDEIISPALENIGDKWACGDISLSEEYMASKICEEIVARMLPPESPQWKRMPVIAITTLGDEHMLGKRIVISILRASGFNVFDYGSISPAMIAGKVKEDGVQILMASTLMLNFAMEVKKLRNIFTEEGITTKIIVGGAPFLFDNELWKEVGADAMAADATQALSRINAVLGVSR